MHGMINRALQDFLRDTHGPETWTAIAASAAVPGGGFEAMLTYPDDLIEAVLEAASDRLSAPRSMILEDLGTYLVCDPGMEPLRRLLRFGGADFLDFLYSLEDLPDRTRLAEPDIVLPRLELTEEGSSGFVLQFHGGWSGFPCVMQGILRAMADDYGALVLLDPVAVEAPHPALRIQLLDIRFAEGRDFSLRGGAS